MIFDTGVLSNELEENTFKKIHIQNQEIVVGKKNDQMFAFNNACPHKGASLHKGKLQNNNIVCYMHGYEYNVFTGKLENMKSWKKDATWIEQNAKWRYSDDLKTYRIYEKEGRIFIEMK